jgi:preprotein translocase subunit SecE
LDGLPVIEFLTAFGYVVLMVIVVAVPIWFLDQL